MGDGRARAAYSDETARVYRSETARRSDLKAPTIPVTVTHCRGVLIRRPLLAQAFALEFDAMGVVHDAVQDGVGQRRVTEHGDLPHRRID